MMPGSDDIATVHGNFVKAVADHNISGKRVINFVPEASIPMAEQAGHRRRPLDNLNADIGATMDGATPSPWTRLRSLDQMQRKSTSTGSNVAALQQLVARHRCPLSIGGAHAIVKTD